MASSLLPAVLIVSLLNGWISNMALAQVSPGVTESVQTSTVRVTQPTTVATTFTFQSTLTPSVTTPPSEISSYDIAVTVVEISRGSTTITANDPDIFDPTTVLFALAREIFIAAMTEIYQNDPALQELFLGIIFNAFRQGSIIADFTVQFKKNLTTTTSQAAGTAINTAVDLNPLTRVGSNSSVIFQPNTVVVGDTDECANATLNNCHLNAVCLNSLGSFACSCKSGFVGDGITCSDEATDRTLLYIMIAVVVLLLFILFIMISVAAIRRREKRLEKSRGKNYPIYDFGLAGDSTPSLTGMPRAKTMVLPPVTSSERYRFYYRNTGWDDN